MKTLLLLPCLALSLFAQTSRPNPSDPKFKNQTEYIEALTDWKAQQKAVPAKIVPCATLAACNKQLQSEREAKSRIEDARDLALSSLADISSERDAFKKKYEDAVVILDTLDTQIRGIPMSDSQKSALAQVQPGKAFDIGVSIEKETGKVFDYANKMQEQLKTKNAAYDSLVDQYNSTLRQANSIINSQNARLARQQQINNALAIYSLMPKSQPYVLPPPPYHLHKLQLG